MSVYGPTPAPPRPPGFPATPLERSKFHLVDAEIAIKRGLQCQRREQIEDAIASARQFLTLAEQAQSAVDPTEKMATSGSLSIRAKRREKQKLGYDRETPTCGSCASFGRNIHNHRPVKWCFWTGFETTDKGLCDAWRGKNGDRLAIPEDPAK
jgi:hypothetical protein